MNDPFSHSRMLTYMWHWSRSGTSVRVTHSWQPAAGRWRPWTGRRSITPATRPRWRTWVACWPRYTTTSPLWTDWKTLSSLSDDDFKEAEYVYTSGFRMRFPHCVAIFYYLPWLNNTKVSYKKLQRNRENACGNRMCKCALKAELRMELVVAIQIIRDTFLALSWSPLSMWHFTF